MNDLENPNFFIKSIKLGKLNSYRLFKHKLIDEEFSKIKNQERIKLTILQRSEEFFNNRNNIIKFFGLSGKNNYNFFF